MCVCVGESEEPEEEKKEGEGAKYLRAQVRYRGTFSCMASFWAGSAGGRDVMGWEGKVRVIMKG